MKLSRRHFLGTLAAGAGSLFVTPGLCRAGASFSRSASTGRSLVLVNFEGGFDSLAMMPPLQGSLRDRYLALRPSLSQVSGPSQHLALNGVSAFGLHPALGVIQSEFNAGNAAIVQKVGLPAPELSHFDAREIMARGRTNLANPDPTGWLGRVAQLWLPGPLDIVGIGVAPQVVFRAPGARPLVVRNLSDFEPLTTITHLDDAARELALTAMTTQTFAGDGRIKMPVRIATRDAYEKSAELEAATQSIGLSGTYSYTGTYNGVAGTHTDELAGSLRDIARMIIAPSIPTRIYYTRTQAYDTHAQQEHVGSGSSGDQTPLSDRLHVAMAALGGFISDLKAAGRWNDTAIVLFSEFGRRNYQNQSQGTDHGWGFHAIVLGGSIQGGLKGNPLSLANLNAGSPPSFNSPAPNFPVEIDYRELFMRCLEDWLLLPPAGQVFPDYTPLPGTPSLAIFP